MIADLLRNGNMEKTRKTRYFKSIQSGWEGSPSAVLVIAGDVGIYVTVINIINCFLLTVNLMKNRVMDPILRCNFKISMSYWWQSKKLNILRYKVQRQQIKQHSFTLYLPNNSLNTKASKQKSRLADERQYFRRHG